MSKYNLVNISKHSSHLDLTRWEFTQLLKTQKDLNPWYYWTQGMASWRPVSQSTDIKMWLSTNWTEDQIRPDSQSLFEKNPLNEFEVVEYSETKPDPKSEFMVAKFSGQVFDFEDSLKAKHLDGHDFKILDDASKNNKDPKAKDFEATVKVDMQKFESTAKIEKSEIENNQFDATVKIEKSELEADKLVKNQKIKSHDETFAPDTVSHKKHNRRYPRVKGRLRTIITNKSKAFMTFTKDISLGGIQVENPIPPDLFNTEIEVYLSDPTGKKSILFRCHPVGEQTNLNRFSFAKADEKNLQKLSQWLDDLAKQSAA